MEQKRLEIANSLYKYRKSHKYNQTKVATLLGMSRQAYSKIECGTTALKPEHAMKLAELYKIPTRMLIDDNSPVDIKMTDEIDVYQQVSQKLRNAELSEYKVFKFKKVKINNKADNEIVKTYQIDEGIRGFKQKDLYAVEITDANNPFNVPVGSKVIVKYIDEKEMPEIRKPTFMVLEWDRWFYPKEANEIDFLLNSEEESTEFFSLVTPLHNLNSRLRRDGSYKTLYKFTYPDGNEFYMEPKALLKMCRGIVKKIIIDY